MTALLVALGAAVGAPLRHLTTRWARARWGATPVGATLLVNITGSLLLGVVAALVAGGAPGWVLALLGIGFCGAFTTFATHAVAVAEAAREGRTRHAVADLGLSLAAGLVAVTVGWWLASPFA